MFSIPSKSDNKTAVILATNVCNAGMFSVDLAAKQFFSCSHDVTFLVAHPERRRNRLFYGNIFPKRYASARQLQEFSRIVFWGDFLLNPMYGVADFSELDLHYGLSKTPKDAFRRWQELFLLKGFAKRSEQKIISFGGNFMNPQSGFHERFTADYYRAELSKFDAIFARDPVSTKSVGDFASPGCVFDGVDAAFLLKSPRTRSQCKSGYFVYFFHRSSIPNIESVVNQIEQKSGLRGLCLRHWLTLNGLKAHLNVPIGRYWTFKKYRRLMSRAVFAFSDTYHFCVNALAVGTPAVGVGISGDQTNSCSDYKKRVLFEMAGMQELYIELHAPDDDSFLARARDTIPAASRQGLAAPFGLLREKIDHTANDLRGVLS
jgi:hypothetical protein